MNKTNQFPKWMKVSAKMLVPGLVLAGIASCQLRDIVPYDDQAHISIDVDWSLMDEEPTGMTVMFYPTDGGKPYVHVTNEVHHVKCDLPENDYDILIFNQSIEEFKTINFRGMEQLSSAEAFIPESTDTDSRIDRLFKNGGRGYNASVQTRPKSLGSSSIPSTSYNNNSGNYSPNSTRGFNASVQTRPKPDIGQLSASIHVRGLNNAIAVNGAITGLASGAYFGIDKLNDTSLTQEMNSWDIIPSADGGIGTITTSMGTFGISPNVDTSLSAGRAIESGFNTLQVSEEDDYRNILYLNFLLKNYTYVSYRFDVTDNIKDYSTDIEVELILDLGTDLEEYLGLPESGMPYENTPVSVTNWGDTINHNITW